MQVFIPYKDYEQSLASLDSQRLNKQALETTQLLDIMFDLPTKTGKERTGWLSHPALLAWKQNPGALIEYLICNIKELENRNMSPENYLEKLKIYRKFTTNTDAPIWLGDERIHSSHRVRLLQKGWETKYAGLLLEDTKKRNTKLNTAEKIITWYQSLGWDEINCKDFFKREYQWPTNIKSDSYSLKECVSPSNKKLKQELIKYFGNNPY